MAMVNKSKRQLKLVEQKNSSLGPGSYDVNYSLASPTSKTAKIHPTHKTKKIQIQPEPDPFQPFYNKQNVVMIKEEEQLYVTEDRKKGLMHRSKTKRIEFGNGQKVPGPGTYNIQKNILKPSVKYQGPKLQKSHILEQIFSSPHYQTTVSIPDFLNQNSVKPKPNPRHKLPATYCSISQPGYTLSKDQRFKQNQLILSQNPGPGAYELIPSQKEKKTEKVQAKPFSQFLDNHMSKITHNTTKYSDNSDSEDSIEYLKEAIPGPGSYNLTSSTISKGNFSKSIQKFGSTAQRFMEEKVYWKGKPFDPTENIKKHSSKRKDLAFGRSKSSNLLKRVDKVNQIGPGFYNDPRTTVNKINQKFQTGYEGNFGTNSIRFKPFKAQYENRTDFYLSPYSPPPEDEQLGTCAFKSRTGQGQSFYPRKDYTTQNYYSQDFNTIKRKLKQQSIRQTEQVVMQPPFGSGMLRFNYKVKQFEQLKQDDEEPQYYEIPLKKAELTGGFTFCKSKSDSKQNQIPGPGTYTYSDNWNSKTHNVLFLT